MPDAIVIGAGPNGLVGANRLADAGLDVLVLEAQPAPGGAVRSGELVEPGFVSDLFSAFYPLGIASPHLRALRLEEHGLEWLHAPAVVAHPASDGTCATLYRDVERTAATVGRFAAEDAEAWTRLSRQWIDVQPAFIDFLMRPFPPVRPTLRMLRRLGSAKEILDFARLGVMPLRRHAEEEFRGTGAGRLLAGNALHADVTPDSMGSALYGWVLCGIGQSLGWPVARGGAQKITDALVARLESRGGQVMTSTEVTAILTSGSRATGVRTADGTEFRASHAILADTGAEALYEQSLAAGRALPNPLAEARALTNLTVVAVESGRHDGAAALHREGLRIYRDLGDQRGIASSLEGLGAAAVSQPHLAAKLYGAASALRDVIGSPVPAVEQNAFERGFSAARSRLDKAAFERAWSQGRAAELDAVIAGSLGPVGPPG
ncbi:FAD-dependent oxidoreductase, partial [uncultured Arthrobacter sp.]|uniref:FAD-dependent oxidoreductase n=1 Tax=uncultured Arthrobacter sp. TaxID=114050 RepID=UPI0032177004